MFSGLGRESGRCSVLVLFRKGRRLRSSLSANSKPVHRREIRADPAGGQSELGARPGWSWTRKSEGWPGLGSTQQRYIPQRTPLKETIDFFMIGARMQTGHENPPAPVSSLRSFRVADAKRLKPAGGVPTEGGLGAGKPLGAGGPVPSPKRRYHPNTTAADSGWLLQRARFD